MLGAEFIAATGGDMNTFGSADRLAGVAGLAPVPATPAGSAATCIGLAATTAACCGSSTSRRYQPSALPRLPDLLRPQTRRRKRHTQAVLALARRRLNVLWAMLRDERLYQATNSSCRLTPSRA